MPSLLDSHRLTLLALIAENDAADTDRAGRVILNGLSDRARRLLQKLEHAIALPLDGPFGDAGAWGENGRAPQIRALVRDSERQREMGAVSRRRAA
jgi:hypothetical protein